MIQGTQSPAKHLHIVGASQAAVHSRLRRMPAADPDVPALQAHKMAGMGLGQVHVEVMLRLHLDSKLVQVGRLVPDRWNHEAAPCIRSRSAPSDRLDKALQLIASSDCTQSLCHACNGDVVRARRSLTLLLASFRSRATPHAPIYAHMRAPAFACT